MRRLAFLAFIVIIGVRTCGHSAYAQWASPGIAFIFCSTSNCNGFNGGSLPSSTQVVNGQTTLQTTTIGGVSVDWYWCSGSPSKADRTLGSLDPRLAGINYVAAGSVAEFCVTLPGTGSTTVFAATGDAGQNWGSQYADICDSTCTSPLFNVATNKNTDCDGSHNLGWVDATATCRQGVTVGANWVANNAGKVLTFGSTTFRYRIGNASSTSFNTLSYLKIQQGSTAAQRGSKILQ